MVKTKGISMLLLAARDERFGCESLGREFGAKRIRAEQPCRGGEDK